MSHNKITILGASFTTGNLGVSALAWSTVNLLKNKYPDAEINVIVGGRRREKITVRRNQGDVEICTWPVRHSPKLFVANHIIRMLLAAYIIRVVPGSKKILAGKNSTLGLIYESELFADITAGDSFSDIYGMKRFIFGYLVKHLCQMTGKPFVMLPQTYGPFDSKLAKRLAAKIVKEAEFIYSRDNEGITVVKQLLSGTDKAAQCPDVAITLEPRLPEKSKIKDGMLSEIVFGDEACQIVGLNVSGLLYNDGYTGNNEFGLVCDYKDLLGNIIEYFASLPNTKVLLVPHVVPEDFEVENDLAACSKLWSSVEDELRNKVVVAETAEGQEFFDQCEIKSIIGKCDFFMGSRMHSTIAAISQCIPTVGLAYSKKFSGVYDTIGIADCVVDLRASNTQGVIDRIKTLFSNKENIRQRLEKNIPSAKRKVLSIFDNLK